VAGKGNERLLGVSRLTLGLNFETCVSLFPSLAVYEYCSGGNTDLTKND